MMPQGTIAALWRYPIKSMRGEEIPATELTEYGLVGDRAYALIDQVEGKAATAKNPGKWPRMFGFEAAFVTTPNAHLLPPVRVTFPDGSRITTDAPEFDSRLSKSLQRTVILATANRGHIAGMWAAMPTTWAGKAEVYQLDVAEAEQVQDFVLPPGTFFDGATIHIVTTATLATLARAYPTGRFEPARFRANIVVHTDDARGYVEQSWVGQTLAIGDAQLQITGPCARCVMTTLAQGGLPQDTGILRTAVLHSEGNVGVYAKVVKPGTIRKGDRLRM